MPIVFAYPQPNPYAADLRRTLGFYRRFGSTEKFRVPRKGSPDLVEPKLGSFNLAVSTLGALRRAHGLVGGERPPRGELVLWVRDVDAAFSSWKAVGAATLSPPDDVGGSLGGAWVADPEGNPVQLVARWTAR